MSNETLTTNEIAAHFRVTPKTILRWVDAGMPVLRPGDKTLRFILADCIAWARERGAA